MTQARERERTPARLSLATALQVGMAVITVLGMVVAVAYGYGALNTKMDDSIRATKKVDERIVDIMKSQPILTTEISLLQLRANLIEAKILTPEELLGQIQTALATEGANRHRLELRVITIEKTKKD